MSQPDLIVVENLLKVYEGRTDFALAGISLEVAEGECFGLLGPNGAGKTTLMGCLLGLLNPDSGSVKIAGLEPTDMAVREVIGFLPERPNFESWFTAREFLTYHHALAKLNPRTRNEDVERTLSFVRLDRDAWDRKTNRFSRGMLQRLGLAQALIGEPKIIFLDEPGSGMDPPGVTLLREVLMELKQKNVTIVLNSHHLDEMERVCDRVAFIRKGQIQAIKSTSDERDYPHILRLRWRDPTGGDESVSIGEALKAVAVDAGATLVEIDTRYARLAVATGEVAATIIEACIKRGIRLQSASPESTSLEHLFKEFPDLLTHEVKDERHDLSGDNSKDTSS